MKSKIEVVHRAGIKIFPKFNMDHKFAVCIEDEQRKVFRQKLTVGEYKHTAKSLNEAIIKTLDFVYQKLLTSEKQGFGK